MERRSESVEMIAIGCLPRLRLPGAVSGRPSFFECPAMYSNCNRVGSQFTRLLRVSLKSLFSDWAFRIDFIHSPRTIKLDSTDLPGLDLPPSKQKSQTLPYQAQ